MRISDWSSDVCSSDLRLGHLAQQTDAICDRPAIIIVAQIGAIAQELVDQIAIRGVQLDPIETGALRIFGSRHIVADDARNFVAAQWPPLVQIADADRRVRPALALGPRRPHRLLAVFEPPKEQPAQYPNPRDPPPT